MYIYIYITACFTRQSVVASPLYVECWQVSAGFVRRVFREEVLRHLLHEEVVGALGRLAHLSQQDRVDAGPGRVVIVVHLKGSVGHLGGHMQVAVVRLKGGK